MEISGRSVRFWMSWRKRTEAEKAAACCRLNDSWHEVNAAFQRI